MSNIPTSSEVKATEVAISLDHPRLTNTDPEAIRTVLRRYNQYTNTVLARARQLTNNALMTEVIKPVDVKYCVDVAFLESSIVLGFINGAKAYKELNDEQVHSVLEERCKESMETVTLEQLERLAQHRIRTKMRNKNATARMHGPLNQLPYVARTQRSTVVDRR